MKDTRDTREKYLTIAANLIEQYSMFYEDIRDLKHPQIIKRK